MSENSIAIFENELVERNQQSRPLEWSSVQNHLASKLVFSSQYTIDQKTIDQLKDSLEECSQGQSPEDCVANYNDLADALHAKSQQETEAGVKLLNESLEAYKKVLMVWTRQDAPSDWSSTFNNLGMIFMALGERTQGKRALEKSVAAFNNALTLRTREDAPQEWAVCQNNMGVSLRILAELSQDVQMLKESVECYEKALEVITPKQSPLGWVMATSNLGDARLMLAMQLNESEFARKATADFGNIVDYFQNARLAKYLVIAKEHQTSAQDILQRMAK